MPSPQRGARFSCHFWNCHGLPWTSAPLTQCVSWPRMPWKVGNGHPGMAMSLAPAAYVLFQKLMRHDPENPDWLGRDRFILSPGHTSLTLSIQLFSPATGWN